MSDEDVDVFQDLRTRPAVEIRQVLEKNFPDINFQNEYGFTLLHTAAQFSGNAEIAGIIISIGAELEIKDKYGLAPLHIAALRGHIDMVEVLVSNGADVNVKDDNCGFTPLHPAACNGHLEIVKLLVSNGADVNAKSSANERGESFTPLELAKAAGKTDVVQYLSGIRGNFSMQGLDKGFVDILKKIVDKHGKGPLLDTDKCSAYMADYAKRDYKEERRLLLMAVEAGVSREMIMPSDNNISCMKQQRKKLQEELKLDPAESLYVVDILAQIFWGCTYNID